MAAQSGAERCVGVEMVPHMAHTALAVIDANRRSLPTSTSIDNDDDDDDDLRIEIVNDNALNVESIRAQLNRDRYYFKLVDFLNKRTIVYCLFISSTNKQFNVLVTELLDACGLGEVNQNTEKQ